MSAFSYSVAHDLRAPLRGIDGFSQALLEDHAPQLGEGGQRYLRRVRESAQHMAQLIDGLLSLARLRGATAARARRHDGTRARGRGSLRASQPDRDVEFVYPGRSRRHGRPAAAFNVIENLFGNAWNSRAISRGPGSSLPASARSNTTSRADEQGTTYC